MNRGWIRKRAIVECSSPYGLHSHCILLSAHCIIPFKKKKRVLVWLIEPLATFPVGLVVYGEKSALVKDNVNDSDIVHLCFLAQIILPSHLDHEKNRGWFCFFFSLTIAHHCATQYQPPAHLFLIFLCSPSLCLSFLPLPSSRSIWLPGLKLRGAPKAEIGRWKARD